MMVIAIAISIPGIKNMFYYNITKLYTRKIINFTKLGKNGLD